MKIADFLVIVLFMFIFGLMIFSLLKINEFMKVLSTCDDDFKIVEICHCVPCSWKDAEIYNRQPCFNINNTSNG